MESISLLKLSSEQLEAIEVLAGLQYTNVQIALYLGFEIKNFIKNVNLPESQIQYHINRGKLISDYKVAEKLLNDAKAGNLTAVMLLEKAKMKQEIEAIKSKLFYGED